MRRAPAIVACVLATLVLAGPASAASPPSRDLRVATTTKIDTLNPLVGTLASEYRVWALNYDILIAFNRRTMEPDLSTSLVQRYDVSSNGLDWTYHLRHGLFWSDGTALTSADVVWTMRFMRRRVDLSDLGVVRSWQAKDRYTVIAHLYHRSVTMKSLWIYILPEHVWKKADNKHWETFQPPLPLVGSGPYTVTKWDANGTTVLERNPYFWRPNTGPQRILMTYYGDSNGAVTDLEQNRLDVMPADTLDPSNAISLQRAPNVRVFRSPPLGLEYWVFDLSHHTTSGVHTEVVQNLAIRRALAWAIDRSKLVEASLFGYGAPGNTQLSRSYGRFTIDLSDDPNLGYHYDPARARRILERGGWKLGKDGVRSKDGVRAEFELDYSGDPVEKRAVTLIRAWARDVGIVINVRVYQYDKLIDLEFNKGSNGKLTPDFDTEIWSIGGDPTPEFLLSLFTKAQIGTWNDSGFTDPKYERLFKDETKATSDTMRVGLIHELQRIATQKLPYIELYEPDDISAVNTRTWRHWTTQPAPVGQPITEYGYDTIIALRPGSLATSSYPACRTRSSRSSRSRRWRSAPH